MLRIFLSIIFLFSSCHNKRNDKKQKQTKTLSISIPNAVTTLDVRKSATPSTCQILSFLYEGLFKINEKGELEPALVDHVEISPCKLKYRFFLKNSCWSDGTFVTAEDFEYAWKTSLTPSFPSLNSHFLFCIKNAEDAKKGLVPIQKVGVYAENSSTLVVKLERPTPHFLKMLSFFSYYPVPKHYFEKHKETPNPSFKDFPTNGPYYLKEWSFNRNLILEKNPKFYEKHHDQIETISVEIIQDALTNLGLFDSGALDFLGFIELSIPPDMVRQYKGSNFFNLKKILETECLFFNTDSYPLNNCSIRKALYSSINRKMIIEQILDLEEENADGLVPPWLYQFEKLKTKALEIQPSEYLQQGLQQLGIDRSKLPTLTLVYFQSSVNEKLALFIQECIRKNLELQVKLEALPLPAFLDKINNKNFQICLMSVRAQYNDPYNFLERFSSKSSPKNYSGFHSTEFKDLLARSSDCLTQKQREHFLIKAEKELLKTVPMGPLFHKKQAYLMNPKLKNLTINPIGLYDFSSISFENSDS